MIVTEKQAATKVCPMSLWGESARNCIGSRCMAWTWHDAVSKVIRYKDTPYRTTFESKTIDLSMRRGRCGKGPTL